MGPSAAALLRVHALRRADEVAVVVRGGARTEHTFGELDLWARRIAGAHAEAGRRPGERVGLLVGNGLPCVAHFFGAAYAGLVVVPIPTVSAAPEVRDRLARTGAVALVADDPRRALAARALEARGAEARGAETRGAETRGARALHAEVTLLSARDAGESPIDAPVALEDGAVAMILFTSGTTGGSKGAVITHASLVAHTAAVAQGALGLSARDRALGVLPLSHSFGIRMAVLAPFHAGARTVLMPRFDAQAVGEALVREEITFLPVVPTMLAALGRARLPRPPRLRLCLSAGAPLTESVRLRAQQRLGCEVRQGWGLTEATFSTIDAPPEPPVPGTVGRPVPGVQVRVVGSDGGPLAAGEAGEVEVRGQHVMAAYLDDPQATAEALRQGWLATGDVGFLDAQGRLTLVDRKKDLIIRGGNNVYPSEVEDVLAAHPLVAEVAVVGLPDERLGEEVVAVIRPAAAGRPKAAELLGLARERLGGPKIPRLVAYVEALPVGPSGKVLRRELRRRVAAGELALERLA